MLKLMLVLAAVIVVVSIVGWVFMRLSGKSKSESEKIDELSGRLEKLEKTIENNPKKENVK